MSAEFTLPKIYPITDRRISGISHAEQTKRLISGGAEIVQLREKYASASDFYDDASVAVDIGRRAGIKIIINDRVDIAIAVGADGVHLGQDDLPPEAARRLLGPNAIIGFSTHSTDQAIAALDLPIDYIAIGPVYQTSTKDAPDQEVGLDSIREVRAAIGEFPLAAIGGIKKANVSEVLAFGANSAAMISEIIEDPDEITLRMRELLAA